MFVINKSSSSAKWKAARNALIFSFIFLMASKRIIVFESVWRENNWNLLLKSKCIHIEQEISIHFVAQITLENLWCGGAFMTLQCESRWKRIQTVKTFKCWLCLLCWFCWFFRHFLSGDIFWKMFKETPSIKKYSSFVKCSLSTN